MSSLGPTGPKLAGTYRLLREISRGVHSTLFEAKNEETSAHVALKLYHRDAITEEVLTRCRRDSEMVAALHHAGILRVTAWSPKNVFHEVWSVTSYLHCESVAERLEKRGRLSTQGVLELGLRVGVILQAAHKVGVIHAGLTPRNLIYTQASLDSLEQGEVVKVVDFGVSHLLPLPGEKEDPDDVYRAPELFEDGVELDGRTDQYALAAILYEAISGEKPPRWDEIALDIEEGGEDQGGPERALEEHLARTCPEAPVHMLRAIERALQPQRADRFPSIMDFLRALDDRALRPLRSSASTPRLSSSSLSSSSGATPYPSSSTPSASTPSRRTPRSSASSANTPPSTNTLRPITLPSTVSSATLPKGPRRKQVSTLLTIASVLLLIGTSVYLSQMTGRQTPLSNGGTLPSARPITQELPKDEASANDPLAAAEAALLRGEPARALEHARQGIHAEPGRAWRIIAKAGCQMRDLRIVEEALKQLTPSDQAQIRASCR